MNKMTNMSSMSLHLIRTMIDDYVIILTYSNSNVLERISYHVKMYSLAIKMSGKLFFASWLQFFDEGVVVSTSWSPPSILTLLERDVRWPRGLRESVRVSTGHLDGEGGQVHLNVTLPQVFIRLMG